MLLCACQVHNITTFEATIDRINENEILVNCSEEVNRGKKGNINAIGYLCSIKITSATVLTNSEGKALSYKDFLIGDLIRINLTKAENIREGSRQLEAAEIVLLNDKK